MDLSLRRCRRELLVGRDRQRIGITPERLQRVDQTMVSVDTFALDRCDDLVRAALAAVGSEMVDTSSHVVFVVDDDLRVRQALADLLSSFDLPVTTFASAADYLAHPRPDVPACLVLDVQLPDINGLDLQTQFDEGTLPPIVFITGHGDIPSTVRAIKAGAVDFLAKPFKEADLMRAIYAGLALSSEAREKAARLADLRQRLSSLTSREREVLPLIASGLLNKQAAVELGISEVTLQIHRGKIMRKMRAGSFAELVRMAAALDVPITRSRPPKT